MSEELTSKFQQSKDSDVRFPTLVIAGACLNEMKAQYVDLTEVCMGLAPERQVFIYIDGTWPKNLAFVHCDSVDKFLT